MQLPLKTDFIWTFADPSQVWNMHPFPQLQVAMVGRSNVGKSSLINALLKTKVARISAEPGKTRAIHFYFWKELNRIVADLPGYGFAKTSKDERNAWMKLIDVYLKQESRRVVILLLWDARHAPLESDIEALNYFSSVGMSIGVVATKVDQLKTQSERHKRRKEMEGWLKENTEGATLFWTSAKEKQGLEEIITHLQNDQNWRPQ